MITVLSKYQVGCTTEYHIDPGGLTEGQICIVDSLFTCVSGGQQTQKYTNVLTTWAIIQLKDEQAPSPTASSWTEGRGQASWLGDVMPLCC